MTKYRNWLFLAAAAVLGGIFLSFLWVNPYGGGCTFSEMVLQLSGSRGRFVLSGNLAELVSFAMRLLPSYLFEFYFGIYFYRRFCTASVYIFSRCPNRTAWYLGEAAAVGIYAAAYQVLLMGAATAVSAWRCRIQFDDAGFSLAWYHILIYFFWTYTISMGINLAATRVGSSTAFSVAFGVQAVCIALLECKRYAGQSMAAKKLVAVNPAAHLVLGWHKGGAGQKDLQGLLDASLGIGYTGTLLLYAACCAAVLAAGAVAVKKHDFIISDAEEA